MDEQSNKTAINHSFTRFWIEFEILPQTTIEIQLAKTSFNHLTLGQYLKVLGLSLDHLYAHVPTTHLLYRSIKVLP